MVDSDCGVQSVSVLQRV